MQNNNLRTAEIFDILSKGQFVCSNAIDSQRRHLYRYIEENFEELEPKLSGIFKKAVFGTALSPQNILDKISETESNTELISTAHSIMGVKVREYALKEEIASSTLPKLLAPAELIESQEEFISALPKLLQLAGKSLSLRLMAQQIIETRRRVNALEYVLIPELERASVSIKMKLSELERASQVTLLKIKDIVRAH